MQWWDTPTDGPGGALAGPRPGKAPDLLVRAGIPVGDSGSRVTFRLTAQVRAQKSA
jgi:hypothetical protein